MDVFRVFVAFLSLCVSAISAFSQSLDSDFTFTLPAGRKECFYQSMKKDASLEIEYQVHLKIWQLIILWDIVRFYPLVLFT